MHNRMDDGLRAHGSARWPSRCIVRAPIECVALADVNAPLTLYRKAPTKPCIRLSMLASLRARQPSRRATLFLPA